MPTYAALIERLTEEFGTVPADFNAWAYLELNPDLVGLFDTVGHAISHYMGGGRAQGRCYRIDTSGVHADFERLVTQGHVVLSVTEAEAVAGGEAAVEVYLARYGLWMAPWIGAIDVAEFRALNQAWCGPVETIGEALVVLLEKGLDRAPALSLRWMFDPSWCRARAGLAQQTSDRDVLLHMLRHGARLGIGPSEGSELERIWGHPDFPECLDWRGYARTIGYHRADPADRCDTLRRFVDQPGLDKLAFVAPMQAAGSFVSFLGQRAWRFGGRVEEARRLFERALALGADPAETHHLLGDLAMATGHRERALKHYRAGALRPTANLWSYYHYAALLIENGDVLSALSVLETCRDRWQERAPWRGLRAQAMRLHTRIVLRDVLTAGGRAMRLGLLDRLLAAIADDLSMPAAWPQAEGGTVILTSRAVSSWPDYRAADRDILVFDLAAIECGDFLAAMLAADTVVFHELPFTYDVLRAVAVARALGRRTVAWLGDLASFEYRPLGHIVFGEEGKDSPAPSLDRCPELMLTTRACDIAVTTVPGCVPLVEAVARRVRLEPVEPMVSPQARESRRILVVPYPAASETERATLAAAISEVVDAEPDLHWFLDPALVRHLSPIGLPCRWSAVDPQIDIQALSNLIGHVAAVVQPLHDPIFAFAGWFEANARGIPAVLVEADDAENVPTQRHVGRPLGMPVSSADVPAVIRVGSLPIRLLELLRATPPAPVPFPGNLPALGAVPMAVSPPLRQRLLFVNVFFAPQVIGGATRVMKDNIDYLLDHHSDAFEICIVCAGEQNERAGEWRLDHYRGAPVFRIATPQELNMDWRATNNQVATRFAAVCAAFRPHLVHIHCLQRLGVGVAEVCQQRQVPYVVTLHDAWWISDFHFLVDENGILRLPQADFTAQQYPRTVSADASWRRTHRLRNALRGATHRLAVSESFARIYSDCGIDCEVNENGASRIEPVQRVPSSDARVHLCHVGGLEHHKGAYLIEAVLRSHGYRHLHFTVVNLARGPDDRTETMWGSTPVTIVGKMSTAAIAKFYARMNVLLAPSTWPESYGLVTREAIEHGLWVIGSDRGAVSEPIIPGRNGFVVSVDDTEDLARALAEIDANPERYRQTPPKVPGQHHADDQSRALIALYRQMPGALAVSEALEHAGQ